MNQNLLADKIVTRLENAQRLGITLGRVQCRRPLDVREDDGDQPLAQLSIPSRLIRAVSAPPVVKVRPRPL
jgi:hypothetical protein